MKISLRKNPLIRNSFKNFATNLLFIFIPMGIVYLFFLFAIFTFVTSFMQTASGTVSELASLIQLSSAESSASVREFFSYVLAELEGQGGVLGILRCVFDPQWIRDTLRGFFSVLSENSAGFEEQFGQIADRFVASVKTALGVAIGLCSLGLILANYATGYAVRRKTAKRDLKRFLLAHALVPLMQSIVQIGCVFLLTVIRLYGILLFAAIIFLLSGLALINAWIVYNDGKLKLKDVLTAENVLAQIVVSLIALALNVVIALLLMLLNPIFALLVTLPVMIYTLKIAEIGADSYVAAKVQAIENGTEPAPAAPSKEPEKPLEGKAERKPVQKKASQKKPSVKSKESTKK